MSKCVLMLGVGLIMGAYLGRPMRKRSMRWLTSCTRTRKRCPARRIAPTARFVPAWITDVRKAGGRKRSAGFSMLIPAPGCAKIVPLINDVEEEKYL